MSVRDTYFEQLKLKDFKSDPAQLRAIDSLARCEEEWSEYKHKRSNSFKKLIVHPPVRRCGPRQELPNGLFLFIRPD